MQWQWSLRRALALATHAGPPSAWAPLLPGEKVRRVPEVELTITRTMASY